MHLIDGVRGLRFLIVRSSFVLSRKHDGKDLRLPNGFPVRPEPVEGQPRFSNGLSAKELEDVVTILTILDEIVVQ